MTCRFCGHLLRHRLIDLGSTALANGFLSPEQLREPESIYPLLLLVCDNCFLVQVAEFEKHPEEIFSADYPYFSSISKTWLTHSEGYVRDATQRFHLDGSSFVIEIASNDGYLLQFFKERGVPCLGIEPTSSTAEVARQKGIETLVDFFDENLALRLESEDRRADLIVANNVLSHVPNLNSFVRGLKIALKWGGVLTVEFPHLARLIELNEFDTIYHEHFSYFSFQVVKRIFEFHGFDVFDVDELPTHGGSLRVYLRHRNDEAHPVTSRVNELLETELKLGIDRLTFYEGLQERANRTKAEFLSFLLQEKSQGSSIAGFGAAAKGNTFLNFCGIKSDLIEYIVDETPRKQGKFLPQSHIPIFGIEKLSETRPDIIVVIPWNFASEIIEKLEFTRKWGARLVTYIPCLQVH